MDMLISHQQVNQLSRWDINISIFSNVKPRSRLARFDLYILNVICTGFEAPEVEIEALYLQYIPILSYSYIMSINVLYSHIYIYKATQFTAIVHPRAVSTPGIHLFGGLVARQQPKKICCVESKLEFPWFLKAIIQIHPNHTNPKIVYENHT